MNLFVKLSCKCRAIYTSYLSVSHFNSCVPKQPFIHTRLTSLQEKPSHNDINIDLFTICHLEKLSLVNFGNSRGIDILVSSIKFAGLLLTKDTSELKPVVTVLENKILHIRPDIVEDGNCSKSVLANAKITEEEYFVAPPGNIPVDFPSHKLKTDNTT